MECFGSQLELGPHSIEFITSRHRIYHHVWSYKITSIAMISTDTCGGCISCNNVCHLNVTIWPFMLLWAKNPPWISFDYKCASASLNSLSSLQVVNSSSAPLSWYGHMTKSCWKCPDLQFTHNTYFCLKCDINLQLKLYIHHASTS